MKTLVFGASLNEARASNQAVNKLRAFDHEVIAIGGREGVVAGVDVRTGTPHIDEVDTITLYMGAARAAEFHEYLIGLNPRRIIFNPGAENEELALMAKKAGIETINACTLVMLSVGNY